MSAQVIEFAEVSARRASRLCATTKFEAVTRDKPQFEGALADDFAFWTGASGRRYVHTVYDLLACPELPNANIVLVHRTADRACSIIQVCRVETDCSSLNLAEIRHKSALLGATEIHVHLLGESRTQRGFIEIDLAAAFDQTAQIRSARN